MMEKSFWERSQHAAKKRHRKNKKGMAVVMGFTVVILIFVAILRTCGETQSDEELLGNQATFYKGIYVEDISLSGMTMSEAKTKVLEKLEKQCKWNMKVVYQDQTYQVEDMISRNLDTILEKAFQIGRTGNDAARLEEIRKTAKNPVKYTLEITDKGQIEDIAKKVAKQFNVEAANADLIGYDAGNKEFQYSEGVTGLILDEKDFIQKLSEVLNEKNYAAELKATMNTVNPELDRATVKERVQLIGYFETITTDNADRNENIRLASNAINGMVLKPGEEFSMNETTGPRTEAEGYKPAGTITNGKLSEEPGGGVCQVSTTLYNAVVKAGIETTERYSHSLIPAYVTPGEDAMVSFPGNDFKFLNNGTSSILILYNFYNNKLAASIYGISTLEEGVTVEMESETAEIIPIPEPTYEEDTSLAYGEEIVVSEGKEGIKVVTYLVTKKNGVEIKRESLHNSTYQAKAPIIKRNSKAKAPQESPTPSPSQEVNTDHNSDIQPTTEPSVEVATPEPSTTKNPTTTKKPTT